MGVMDLLLLWTAATLVTLIGAEEVVDRSNMSLTYIPSTLNSNTTKLILHNNSIVMNISDVQALSMYPNLTELDLSTNHIAQLPEGAFSNLTKLDTLSLRGNRLQTLSEGTFHKRLRKLDLGENPWNCSCEFVNLVMELNQSGVQIGPGASCASTNELPEKPILGVTSACLSTTSPPTVTTTTTTITTTTSNPTVHATSAAATTTTTTTTSTPTPRTKPWPTSNNTNKDSLTHADKSDQQEATLSNTWKFLTGVVVIALCTSLSIVCAVKSPSWYKMLFNYRHQRLREVDEPSGFGTGRYSNFSLDTEQTETSAQELDQGPEHGLEIRPMEEEDGFIEDRYIQPEDYKDHEEDTDNV